MTWHGCRLPCQVTELIVIQNWLKNFGYAERAEINCACVNRERQVVKKNVFHPKAQDSLRINYIIRKPVPFINNSVKKITPKL